MGGMGGMGAAGGGQSIRHVNSAQEFEEIVRGAGAKPIVVDFFTTWCGPCKRIGPVFQELANTHQQQAIFVKVDGDKCKALVAAKGVKGYPTFQVYVKGAMVENFSGADENRLRSAVQTHAAAFTARPPCPYKHFPLRDEESVSFTKIKWSIVEDKIKECSQQIAQDTGTAELSLEGKDSTDLDDLLVNLKNKYSHHSTPISPAQLAVMDKMLQWPGPKANQGLHTLRMLLAHPHAAKSLAGREPNSPEDVVTRLCAIAGREMTPVTSLLLMQAMCNCFCRRVMTKVVAPRSEEMLDVVATLIADADKRLQGACIALLINFAIVFREDNDKYESAKVHMLTNMAELMSLELDSKIAYRALVVLGTLIYRDPGCTEIAKGIELNEMVETMNKTHSEDLQVVAVAQELAAAFANPER